MFPELQSPSRPFFDLFLFILFQVREAYRKGCDQQPVHVAGIQRRKQSNYRKSVRVSSVEEEVDAAGNM